MKDSADHWDEPARCRICGQEKSTHDDGEHASVRRAYVVAGEVKDGRLTPLEFEAMIVCRMVLEALVTKTVDKSSYVELMGIVRALATKLENKSYGCFTGKHSGTCSCSAKT